MENDHQTSFPSYENPQLFSNLFYHSGPSSSLNNNSNAYYPTCSLLGTLSMPIMSKYPINVSLFESRIHNLQLRLSEQSELSNMCSEKNYYLNSQVTSDLTQEINTIRSNIDVVLQSDIRSKSRTISDKLKNTKKNINSLNFSNETSDIRSKLSDLVREISLFKNDLMDHIETSQNSFRKIKFDHERILNQTNQSLSKILSIESRLATIIQKSDEQNTIFDQADQKILSSFTSCIQNSNELIQNNSNTLANGIKTESISRESVNLLLQKQASTISDNISSNLTRLINDYKEIHKSFNKMIQDTCNQISSSIEETQNSTDSMIFDINRSFNQLFDDIQKSFESFQTDIIETVSSLNKNSNDALFELENVLQTEAKYRENNNKIFHDKFNQFSQIIIKEQNCQINQIKDMEKKINSLKSDIFDKKMKKSLKVVNELVKTTENLNEIESKIDSIENEFNESFKSIQDDIRNNDLNITEIASSFEIHKNEISKSFDFIEQIISKFEPRHLDSKIEFKQKIEYKNNEFIEYAQNRIENANRRLEVVLAFLEKNNISLTTEFTCESKTDIEIFNINNDHLSDKTKEPEIEEEEEVTDNETYNSTKKEEDAKDQIIIDDKNSNSDSVSNAKEENKDPVVDKEIKTDDKSDIQDKNKTMTENKIINPIKSIGSTILQNIKPLQEDDDHKFKLSESDFIINFIDPRKK